MKKIISVLLSAIIVFSVFGVYFTAFAYSEYDDGISDIPCIYVQGKSQNIVTSDGEYVYLNNSAGINGEGIDIGAAIQECLPYLKDAFLTDDWTAYQQKLLEVVDPMYCKLRLDGDGNPQYGTHQHDLTWIEAQYHDIKAPNGKYALTGYLFLYDWRLDPFETADILHTFIENVKAATGKDKVNITARCEGTNVMGAYLAEYGSDDINCLNLYVSTLNGSTPYSSIYSGNMNLDIDALKRFKDEKTLIGDEFINALVDSTAGLLIETYASNGLSIALKPFIAKLYKEAVVPVLRASYATMPGMWGLVGKDDYQTARNNIFGGCEEEYGGLLEKLDNYDEKVRQVIDELLLKAVENGTKVSIWAKYGDYAIVPFCRDNQVISDSVLALSDASFGSAATHIGEVFSDKYIEKAEKENRAKYISPDKVCDLSTAVLPDTTWVIYNSEHSEFPASIHELMARFIVSDGTMTVWSDETAPQYLYCSDDQHTVSPLTAENGMQPADNKPAHTKQSIKDKVMAFVKSILALIKNFFMQKFSAIGNK